jgi:hypothetical protein
LQNVNMTVVLAFSLKEITNGPLEIGYFVWRQIIHVPTKLCWNTVYKSTITNREIV